jgi:HPt (histidine-containing phosphotransfer) domain-containing protein
MGDAVAASRHAHAIAGAAGNLGAGPLREAAKALEAAGRENRTDLSDQLRVVEERAAAAFASIESLRRLAPKTTTPAPPVGPVDPARLRAALERLRSALEDSDPSGSTEALGALRELGASGETRNALVRAGELAERYEYDTAAGIVAGLLKDL